MTFYNENDPKAAAWLRELISAGHIAHGVVDERSITDLKAADLHGYTQCHFFAGIGGWSYALRLAGWPDEKPVWTGSCPCQPFSAAGKRKVDRDSRHLWPAFRELIAECKPAIIFGEQVASKDGRIWLARVRTDLEALGHAVGAADLCAAGLGAPQIRQRLWWVANSTSHRRHGAAAGTESARRSIASRNGWLADAASIDGPQHEREPRNRSRRQAGPSNTPECGGPDGGMDNAASAGREGGNSELPPRGQTEGRLAGGPSYAGWLGSSDRQRLEQHAERNRETQRSQFQAPLGTDISGSGFWSQFDIIPCADGKARRVESGTFPLAHGVPGRVGLLRGYGNAIVPQVAAEFIQAAREALT